MSKQNFRSKTKANGRTQPQQPKKDSRNKRVNYDNTRESKFVKDMDGDMDRVSNPKRMRRSGSSNDVSWYAGNQQLLQAAASIPFNDVTGSKLGDIGNYSVPGVCALYWTPFIGCNNSAVTQSMNNILSYTVHANSRTNKYDAPDR